MQPIREINNIEKAILEYPVKKSSIQLPNGWIQSILVQPFEDGGMGSFLIFQNSSFFGVKRKFAKQISEFQFVDDDGVTVLVSLNIDGQNNLFEVDVWKVDYNPVINFKIPS